jgi:hypothetical protein
VEENEICCGDVIINDLICVLLRHVSLQYRFICLFVGLTLCILKKQMATLILNVLSLLSSVNIFTWVMNIAIHTYTEYYKRMKIKFFVEL